tara:strand:+ start:1926 stop:3698 length:1773 start_codon:yes stop_codon:yes gene_type:complete
MVLKLKENPLFFFQKDSDFWIFSKYIFESISKKNLLLVLFLVILGSFAELISVFSVVLFLQVLSNPNTDSEIFSKIKVLMPSLSIGNNLVLFSALFFSVIVSVASIVKFLSLKKGTYFASRIGTKISYKFFNLFLNQKFESYLLSKESHIVNTSQNHANSLVMVLNNLIFMISGIISSIGIMLALSIYNFRIAIISFIIIGIAYFLVTFNSRKKLSFNGRKISQLTGEHVKLVKDVYGSYRDILITNQTTSYAKEYDKYDSEIRSSRSESLILSIVPRFFLEPFLMLCLAFYILQNSSISSNSDVLVSIGTFAFSAQRLLPAIQQIFSGYAGVKTHIPSSMEMLYSIENYKKNMREIYTLNKKSKVIPKNLVLDSVCYSYPNSKVSTLSSVDFSVKLNEFIGISGVSGSGKSTLVDIIMGLLKPSNGKIIVDGNVLNKESDLYKYWRRFIAHVPQRVYLSNTSIKENILFGINHNKDKILNKIADLSLVSSMLPKEVDWRNYIVGSNGSRLSGGQRQRIAIARALILEKPYLIFDEATSALDKQTEEKIILNIKRFLKNQTVILISHSKNVLDLCDRTYIMRNKKLEETF